MLQRALRPTSPRPRAVAQEAGVELLSVRRAPSPSVENRCVSRVRGVYGRQLLPGSGVLFSGRCGVPRPPRREMQALPPRREAPRAAAVGARETSVIHSAW